MSKAKTDLEFCLSMYVEDTKAQEVQPENLTQAPNQFCVIREPHRIVVRYFDGKEIGSSYFWPNERFDQGDDLADEPPPLRPASTDLEANLALPLEERLRVALKKSEGQSK